ncbi:MAG TPA: heme o synthase, partial [Gaiellaceae bacterium]|nr:heme o synthase [Gaiellaceae bacterium]
EIDGKLGRELTYVKPGDHHVRARMPTGEAFDRDIDVQMKRTASRPIPSGRVAPRAALLYGCLLALLSVLELSLTVNPLAAALSFCGFLGYVFVYTVWLKRRTPQNIVIGGAAGAVPPLVGWAAATGNVAVPALILFAIVFVWTPPHFWALALLIKENYANARVPMLPVVRGERETARQIVLYSVVLVAVTLAPWAYGSAGLLYLASALALGAVFVWLANRLRADLAPRNAALLFHYSLLYLALLFVALALDPLA